MTIKLMSQVKPEHQSLICLQQCSATVHPGGFNLALCWSLPSAQTHQALQIDTQFEHHWPRRGRCGASVPRHASRPIREAQEQSQVDLNVVVLFTTKRASTKWSRWTSLFPAPAQSHPLDACVLWRGLSDSCKAAWCYWKERYPSVVVL